MKRLWWQVEGTGVGRDWTLNVQLGLRTLENYMSMSLGIVSWTLLCRLGIEYSRLQEHHVHHSKVWN